MDEKKLNECINYLLHIKKTKGIEKLELKKYIKKELETIQNDGYILRLDIDNLRGINAARGNSHGDVLIEYTYQCIMNVLSQQQKVFCLSGGEFIIISPNHTTSSAEELYKKIQQEIIKLIMNHEYRFSFSVCGGIFYVEGSETTFEEILKCSEFTLETAKKKGPNECYVFCINDYYERVSNHHLKLMLQKAVNNDFDGFVVNFQPIANAKGQIKAAEALLRFQKEDVTINPSLLIALLEETGLIISVGQWTLKKALEFCNHVRRFDKKFIVSVNMSYIEASDDTRLDYILETLDKFEVPASNLSIELTESGLLETDKNIQRLWQGLKKAGVFISLDDFGTGFSNFHYIEDIKPDLLKVDYMITQQAMQSDRYFKILEAISSVVQHLELKLCVEGIEDKEVFDKMKPLGASFYQGYHFSKPCTSDKFIKKFFVINKEEEENECSKNK